MIASKFFNETNTKNFWPAQVNEVKLIKEKEKKYIFSNLLSMLALHKDSTNFSKMFHYNLITILNSIKTKQHTGSPGRPFCPGVPRKPVTPCENQLIN